MLAWVRRTFPTWTHFGEYLAVMGACIAGIGALPWSAGIVLPTLLLTLLSWPRWRELVLKAWRLDREWRELGDLASTHNVGSALDYYLRSRNVLFVLGAKVLHDCFFISLAFAFGHVIAWLWFR